MKTTSIVSFNELRNGEAQLDKQEQTTTAYQEQLNLFEKEA